MNASRRPQRQSPIGQTPWRLGILVAWLGLCFALLSAQDGGASYDDRMEKAVTFYSEKKYEEAAALFSALTRSEPDRKEGFLWLGNAHRQLRNWSEAREAYTAYTRLAPKDVQGYRESARVLEQEGRTEDALAAYRQALEIEPGNPDFKAAVARLATPAAPDAPAAAPAAAAPEEAKPAAPDKEDPGFWRIGLAGVCKARTVWWGRALALLFFIGGLVQLPILLKAQAQMIPSEARDAGGCVLFFAGGIGCATSYILFWGIPSDWGWALFALCVLLGAGAGAAAAKEAL